MHGWKLGISLVVRFTLRGYQDSRYSYLQRRPATLRLAEDALDERHVHRVSDVRDQLPRFRGAAEHVQNAFEGCALSYMVTQALQVGQNEILKKLD